MMIHFAEFSLDVSENEQQFIRAFDDKTHNQLIHIAYEHLLIMSSGNTEKPITRSLADLVLFLAHK